ncbi:MAG: hypothetical protein ACLR4W_15675 [Oscillospiraceae bacterium]
MERLSQAAALCSEVTVILAALALLVKPLRDQAARAGQADRRTQVSAAA